MSLCIPTVKEWKELKRLFRYLSTTTTQHSLTLHHYDVMAGEHLHHYWTFVTGIHGALVNSHHEGSWCSRVLLFSLMSTWTTKELNRQSIGDATTLMWHYCNVTITTSTLPQITYFVEALRVLFSVIVQMHSYLNRVASLQAGVLSTKINIINNPDLLSNCLSFVFGMPTEC